MLMVTTKLGLWTGPWNGLWTGLDYELAHEPTAAQLMFRLHNVNCIYRRSLTGEPTHTMQSGLASKFQISI